MADNFYVVSPEPGKWLVRSGASDLLLESGQITDSSGAISFGDDTLQTTSLAASSGVYTDASSILSTTPPTSGTLGYWDRTGTTLSPATAGDDIDTTGRFVYNSSGAAVPFTAKLEADDLFAFWVDGVTNAYDYANGFTAGGIRLYRNVTTAGQDDHTTFTLCDNSVIHTAPLTGTPTIGANQSITGTKNAITINGTYDQDPLIPTPTLIGQGSYSQFGGTPAFTKSTNITLYGYLAAMYAGIVCNGAGETFNIDEYGYAVTWIPGDGDLAGTIDREYSSFYATHPYIIDASTVTVYGLHLDMPTTNTNRTLYGIHQTGIGDWVLATDNCAIKLGAAQDFVFDHTGSASRVTSSAPLTIEVPNALASYYVMDASFRRYIEVGSSGSPYVDFGNPTNNPSYTFLGTGSAIFGGNVALPGDNRHLYIGTGNDLDIYHDGSNTFIANATGDLFFEQPSAGTAYFYKGTLKETPISADPLGVSNEGNTGRIRSMYVYSKGTHSIPATAVQGLNAFAEWAGSANIGIVEGGKYGAYIYAGGGTVTEAYGVNATNSVIPTAATTITTLADFRGAGITLADADATITSYYGLKLGAVSVSAGTITTAYGINIGDITGGGTNYAIKTGLGPVDFGDVVTTGGSAAGQSTIASGLIVNDAGGGATADDFIAETDNFAEALHVDASDDKVIVNAEFCGGRYAVEFRDYSSLVDNNYMPRNLLESSSTRCNFIAPWAGSVVGLSITVGQGVGTYSVYPAWTVRINGVATSLNWQSSAGVYEGYDTAVRGVDTFSAGDLIQVFSEDYTYTAGGTWSHATATVILYFDT